MCACVCPRRCLRNHTRDLYLIFCVLCCPMSMAQSSSSSGTLTIGRIAYRRERGDGSAQSGRSVIYDWLGYYATIVYYFVIILFYWFLFRELLNLLSSGNSAAVRVGGGFRHKGCGLCGVNSAGRSNFRCYYLPNANCGLQSCCMWLQYSRFDFLNFVYAIQPVIKPVVKAVDKRV